MIFRNPTLYGFFLIFLLAFNVVCAEKPELVVQVSHVGIIHSAAFSPDGKFLASGGGDTTIKLWRVSTGTLLRTLKGHTSSVTKVEFKPDGKTLISASTDGTLRLWDVFTGKEVSVLKREGAILNFSQSGNVVVCAEAVNINKNSSFDLLTVREWSTGEVKIKVNVSSGTYSLDNNFANFHLLSMSASLRRFRAYNFANLVSFSRDGEKIAIVNNDKEITLWNIRTGKELNKITEHSDYILSVAFSPNGEILATGSKDKTIKIWDVKTKRQLHNIEHGFDFTFALTFSFDGRTVMSGSENNTIQIWDTGTGRELYNLTAGGFTNGNAASAVAFNSDASSLASAASDGTIRFWENAAKENVRIVAGAPHFFSPTINDPSGSSLAKAQPFYETIALWNFTEGAPLRVLGSVDLNGGFSLSARARPMAFSPDGKYLAEGVCGRDYCGIKLWDMQTLEVLKIFKGDSKITEYMTFSPNGRILASATLDKTIKLWDVATQALLHTFAVDERTFALTFSADGKTLMEYTGGQISLTFDSLWSSLRETRLKKIKNKLNVYGRGKRDLLSINFWDVMTGTRSKKITLDHRFVTSMSLNPDGKTLATASADAIKLWDLETGKQLNNIQEQSRRAQSVAFSPNGEMLAIGNYDGIVNLLTIGPDAKIKETQTINLKAQQTSIASLAFSKDGRLLFTGAADSSVKLWDIKNEKEICTLISFGVNDWLVATPDGLFDGTPAAWSKISWRFNNNTLDYAPAEAFFSEFYYPNLLQDIFTGKQPKASQEISQKDRRQPQLKISPTEAEIQATTPATGRISSLYRIPGKEMVYKVDRSSKRSFAVSPVKNKKNNNNVRSWSFFPVSPVTLIRKFSTRTVKLKIEVTEAPADENHKQGGGAQDVRLFRNGSLVKVWRGDVLKGKQSITLEATVSIVAGENKFTAYAFSSDNVKSADAAFVLEGAESLKRKGTAYVLTVGVNEYANSEFNLRYAAPDADLFGAEMLRQQAQLDQFAKIEVVKLLDSKATKKNLLTALNRLSGLEAGPQSDDVPKELQSFQKAQPEDVVIVYFAGHGLANEGNFYLVPHDLGYKDSLANLTADALSALLEHSMSDRELEEAFAGIDAGNFLLVIDACRSGQALESEEQRRGPMNVRGLVQLAHEKGMYIVTASQSHQEAIASAKLGHGYLTYALAAEGLREGKADAEPNDGNIMAHEWLKYAVERVPLMQRQEMRERRILQQEDSKKKKAQTLQRSSSEPQRPHIFYRRETEALPWIVAKPVKP